MPEVPYSVMVLLEKAEELILAGQLYLDLGSTSLSHECAMKANECMALARTMLPEDA